ncbi:hypothetical protein B1R94_04565 [Mycolicibacterium litorale]|nr:hypothetical protein B1R94_04565 [Mycolicibacterium litorale]
MGTGDDPATPGTEPLSWAVLAVTRRERITKSVRLADGVTVGEAVGGGPLSPPAGSATTDPPVAASVTAGADLGAAVHDFIDRHLPGWTPIADELAPIVADGIQDLLSNGSVSAEVNRLVTNTAVMQFFSMKVSTALGSYWGVPPAVGTVIGDAAANLVRNTLGNAGVQSALDVVAHAVMPTPDQYGAITAGLAGGDVAPLGEYLTSIVPRSAGDVATFLSTPAVQAALASATSQVVIDLTQGSEVPAWLGDVVARAVSAQLGGPAGTAIGTALGSAVQGLLGNTTAMQGLATAIGAAVPSILGAPHVAAAVADAVTALGSDILDGTHWLSALDQAWWGLRVDPSFRSALSAAAGGAFAALATNSDVVSAVTTGVAALITDVAADPAARAFVSALVGPTYGPSLLNTLADPASAAQLAATAGTVITGFLGQPGVAAVLSAATTQTVAALMAGVAPTDVLHDVLQSLQADPVINAALDATLPAALRSALAAPAVKDVISGLAQGVVADLLGRTPLNNTVFDPAAGQVTKAAIDALLSNPAAQDLISSLAGDVLNGTPPGDITTTLIDAVVKSQQLQVALGVAVGQGIGALFGDNPLGFLVGQVVGAAAALVIGIMSGAAVLFNLAGAATVPAANSYRDVMRLDRSGWVAAV